MIERVTGNLLEADAEALVNTVNCVGVMGKGIALQFRQAFPDNAKAYRRACKEGKVQPGSMLVYDAGPLVSPRYIINFPTKRHWKGKSRIEDVRDGLLDLVRTIQRLKVRSIAIPPLGCGNGGLAWEDVRPLIEKALTQVPGVRTRLYEPEGAPARAEMPVRTKRPAMTAGRAALLGIFRRYLIPGYQLTMLEVQKLAYFLQATGEPLRLKFAKAEYGPYAETLHHVLQRMEGHFVRGYGDRSREVAVTVVPEAADEAERYLALHAPGAAMRQDRVASLIEGFDSPYGLELLATVHWAGNETVDARRDADLMVQCVHAWNDHKRNTMKPEHIRLASRHLQEQGWWDPSETG